jgi:hypothetical protein
MPRGPDSAENPDPDERRHRHRLETQVMRGALLCFALIVIVSFGVLGFGNAGAHTEVPELSALFEGPVLAALGYAFGRQERR